MNGGVEVRPAEGLLVARARDFLAAGPSEATQLVAHICQLPSPPRSVAEHMAMALLADYSEFAHDTDGRWRLADPPVASTGWGSLDMAGRATGRRTELVREPRAAPAAVHQASPREPLDEMSFVVVDVETTGGRPYGGDRITEIAAIVVERGEVVHEYESLVNPQRRIPPMITALTNITWDMVKKAPTFRDISRDVTAVLCGRVFVAHNATFDWRFVSSEIGRASGETLTGRKVCTVRLARRVLPHLSRRSLDHLARYYGVEITQRHRAGGDARATARVLVRLLRDARDRGCHTWAELDALLQQPSPRRRRRRTAMPRFVDRDPSA